MRAGLVVCALFSSTGIVTGCSRSSVEGAATDSAAFVETSNVGSVAWSIAPDGGVHARVKTPDGKLATENVSGTMEWKTASGPKTVVLTPDKRSGELVAAAPTLEADLTQVDYTVSVQGAPMSGTLFLPRGGTADLAAPTPTAAPTITIPDGKKGPHGGPIEVVGSDRLELVASRKGEVRVYVLDANLQPVAVGARTIRLGVGGASPEVVVLSPAPAGMYLVGHWKVSGAPARITLEERDGDRVYVVVVGHRPGVLVVAPAVQPPETVVIVEEFEPRHREDDDDDDQGDHGKDYRVHVRGGKGAKFEVKIK
jgi:hypothetical protein